MFSCLPGRVGQILGNVASGPMVCVCSVACAAEEPPQFLRVALKVVFAAFSVQICWCRVSGTEIQLAAVSAPAQLPRTPSAVKSLCVPAYFFSLEVVMDDAGKEEKKLSWLQENLELQWGEPSPGVRT